MAADGRPPTSLARRLLALLAYPLLFVAMLVLIVLFREELWAVATAPDELRVWVRGFGVVAPLAFIAVQVVQVVIFIIPGEVPQIASGYLFGIAGGLALTSLGIAIGSGIAFLASRLLGIEFLSAILRREQLDRMRQVAASPRATITFFLFFLIPGIPKDILCYVAGLSRMRFIVFIVISTVGRLPGIRGQRGDGRRRCRGALAVRRRGDGAGGGAVRCRRAVPQADHRGCWSGSPSGGAAGAHG